MISTIAKLLHLPAIETVAELKRLHAEHGHAVDEDRVKAIAVELRQGYDALRAELNAARVDNAAYVLLAETLWAEHVGRRFNEERALALKWLAERAHDLLDTPSAGAPLLKELAQLREDVKDCHDRCMEKCGAELAEANKELADLRAKLATVERERDGLHQTIADMGRDYRDNLRACDELLADAEAMAKALVSARDSCNDVGVISEANAALAVWRASHPEGETT